MGENWKAEWNEVRFHENGIFAKWVNIANNVWKFNEFNEQAMRNKNAADGTWEVVGRNSIVSMHSQL